MGTKFFFDTILAVLSFLTVKTLAVSSRGGEEALKACAPFGACVASSCWLCAYVRGSGPPGTPLFLFFFFSFLLLLWLFSRSVACCSLDVRAAYTAVYDRYFSSRPLPCSFCQVCRQLAAAIVLAVLGECVCFCSRGAFSHISPPPRASIGLELAFTLTWRTPFFGAVRFPPSR